MSDYGDDVEEEAVAGASGVFCLSIYPEGIAVINADNDVLDFIKATVDNAYPTGIHSTEAVAGGVMLRLQGGLAAGGAGGGAANTDVNAHFLFSNQGKVFVCQVLGSLESEGWALSGSAMLDSVCVYNLPEEIYPVTTWFFKRTALPPVEDEEEEEPL